MKRFAVITLIFLVFCVGARSGAEELLSIPYSQSGELLLKTKTTGARYLFNSSERAYLEKHGKSKLAQARVLDRQTAKELKHNNSLSFDQNATVEIKQLNTGTDPLFSSQWHLSNFGQGVRVDLDDLRTVSIAGKFGEDLNLPSNADGNRVKVAILDTGVDITHPDLRGRIAFKEQECALLTKFVACAQGEGKDEAKCRQEFLTLDSDQNGYELDCAGWNAVGLNGNAFDVEDPFGHGTHVAGIVAAEKNNGLGGRGVSPFVKLIPIRVVQDSPTAPIRPQNLEAGLVSGLPTEQELRIGKSSVELIARGLLYAIREGAQVINMSLGWPASIQSRVISELLDLADKQGIFVVAAAGNDSTESLVFPCAIKNVICVGAHGPDGKRAHFSNYGPGVDLYAPGTSILSTYPIALRSRVFTALQGYEIMNGTSMAAPMVSGAMALMLSLGIPKSEILPRLLSGAREGLRLDVMGAIQASPRPIVRKSERDVIKLQWSQLDQRITSEITLINSWKSAAGVRVRALGSDAVTSAEVLPIEVEVGNWESGTQKTIKVPIQLLGYSVPREMRLNLEICFLCGTDNQVRQSIVQPVRFLPAPLFQEKVLLSSEKKIVGELFGKSPIPQTLIGTQSLTPERRDYVVLSKRPGEVYFQLLRENANNQYEYSKPVLWKDGDWAYMVAHRYYSGEVGNHRIAIFSRKKNEFTGLTEFKIDLYSDDLQDNIRTITYNASKAPLPENFRWVTYGGKDAILFVVNGTEGNKDDPWNTQSDDRIALRSYVLDSAGVLQEFNIDSERRELRIVGYLPLSTSDVKRGTVALLAVSGFDYFVDYSIATFKDGKIISLEPFTLNPYQNLSGLAQSPFWMQGEQKSGVVLSSSMGRGRLKSIVFERGQDEIGSSAFQFGPMSELDGISRMVGGFELGTEKIGFYVQTTWELQYHEFVNKRELIPVKASMNRFSFLPAFVSQRAFFPIWANDGGSQAPGLLIMDAGSGQYQLSVMIPKRNEKAEPVGLYRPAILQFEQAPSGCTYVGNPSYISKNESHQMTALCSGSVKTYSFKIP